MISMYSDAALPISIVSPAQNGHVSLLRDATREHTSRGWNDDAHNRRFEWSTKVDPPSGDRLHDDALDAVRGLALSVVLGLGCWVIIGIVVRALFF